jgi:hypothetical protein
MILYPFHTPSGPLHWRLHPPLLTFLLSFLPLQRSEPYCQPYGNRRLLHCVPKGVPHLYPETKTKRLQQHRQPQ